MTVQRDWKQYLALFAAVLAMAGLPFSHGLALPHPAHATAVEYLHSDDRDTDNVSNHAHRHRQAPEDSHDGSGHFQAHCDCLLCKIVQLPVIAADPPPVASHGSRHAAPVLPPGHASYPRPGLLGPPTRGPPLLHG